MTLAIQVEAAGFQRVEAPVVDGRPLELGIWYPTKAKATVQQLGHFRQAVATNSDISGDGLPLVLISHGTGGALANHYDTALDLAEAGFVVAALTHPGDNMRDRTGSLRVMDRPRHVRRALDFLLGEWPGRAHLDGNRVGIFGFSAGGFTALVVLGGKPNPSRFARHCGSRPMELACRMVMQAGGETVFQEPYAPISDRHDKRIKAAVIAAPALGFAFGVDELKDVVAPIQLWRAEHDVIVPHAWYAEVIRRALPQPPDYRVASGAGHFDFLAPCSDALASQSPEICRSLPGFDRRAFHRDFNEAVVRFFARTLGDERRP